MPTISALAIRLVLDSLLAEHRLDPRELLAQRAHLVARLGLPHRSLDAQAKHLIVEIAQALAEILRRQAAQIVELLGHLHTCSCAKRWAKRVFIGSLAEASRIAARASAAVTPSISNRMR